jgi:hypothetical protein
MIYRAELRNPCNTVAHVVTQEIGGRYKARPGSKLITQVSGIKPESCLLNQLSIWEIARICKSLTRKMKLLCKTALSNR